MIQHNTQIIPLINFKQNTVTKPDKKLVFKLKLKYYSQKQIFFLSIPKGWLTGYIIF